MRKNYLLLIVMIATFLILINANVIFAQWELVGREAEAQIQRISGYVIEFNPQNKTIMIGSSIGGEAEKAIAVDEKTIYEDFKSIEDIKELKDTARLDIDYIVSQDGRNIARRIRVLDLNLSPADVEFPYKGQTAHGDLNKLTEADRNFIDAVLYRSKLRAQLFISFYPYRGFPETLRVGIGNRGYVLTKLDYEKLSMPYSTGRTRKTFWKSEEGYYFYRTSGGCEVYVDNLYGPYRLEKDKFVVVESK